MQVPPRPRIHEAATGAAIPHIKYDVCGRRGGRVLYLPSELLRSRQGHHVGVRDLGAEAEKMIMK